jgi:hypothetical protein
MNKKVSQQDSKKKRRKLGFWWWSIGAVLTLATLVTCSLSFPLNNSGVASSASTSSTQVSSTPTVSQLSMVAVEVSTMPSKLNYNPTETISTSGGILRVVLSDYSVRYVAMNDAMIDQSRIDLSRLGTTNINVRYSFNDVTLFTSYQINVVSFDVAITKVSLDVSDVNIITDQVVTLKYLLEPTNGSIDSVVWTSNNPLIAGVDEFGNVSGKSIGSTTINVSINGSFTASARVNIVAPTIAPPNTGFVNRQPSEPSDADWIPIASGDDLMMISIENATYTFAEGTNAAVSFTNNTPGMSGKYYLLNNINLSTFDNSAYDWSEQVADNSIIPIGYLYDFDSDTFTTGSSNKFTGEFDGNNKIIDNMKIALNRNSNRIGLFSVIENGLIYDLEIKNPNINQNSFQYERVGALAGSVEDESEITNVKIVGGNIVGFDYAGGLIGRTMGESSKITLISTSSSTANVTGNRWVGGLVAKTEFTIISGSYATGVIFGTTNVGGLVGEAQDSKITYFMNESNVMLKSYATGNIIGTGYDVGGLVGESDESEIEFAYSTGNISAILTDEIESYKELYNLGGLVGYNNGDSDKQSTIKNSYASGSVTVNLVFSAPPLDAIYQIYAIGGLTGNANESWILNSHSTGIVSVSVVSSYVSTQYSLNGESIKQIGGLVGLADMDTKVESSWSSGNVIVNVDIAGDVNDNNRIGLIGGLIGEMVESDLVNSYASGNVSTTFSLSGSDNQIFSIGGLVGNAINSYGDSYVESEIFNSYATGNVTADFTLTGMFNYYGSVGGLIGNAESVDIISSYATGNVLSNGEYTGGLIGYLYGFYNEISDKYLGKVVNSYYSPSSSNNKVVGINYVGGLIGEAYNAYIKSSYSTGEVNGIDYVGGLIGASDIGGGPALRSILTQVFDSFSSGNVLSTSDFGDLDHGDIGGLIGEAYDTIIQRSFATGNISAPNASKVGGLIGHARDTLITDAYAQGNVTGKENTGGLIGKIEDTGVFEVYSFIVNTYSSGTVTNNEVIVDKLIGINVSQSVEDPNSSSTIVSNSYFKGSGTQNGSTTGTEFSDNLLKLNDLSAFKFYRWSFVGSIFGDGDLTIFDTWIGVAGQYPTLRNIPLASIVKDDENYPIENFDFSLEDDSQFIYIELSGSGSFTNLDQLTITPVNLGSSLEFVKVELVNSKKVKIKVNLTSNDTNTYDQAYFVLSGGMNNVSTVYTSNLTFVRIFPDLTAPTATLTPPQAGPQSVLTVTFDEALNSSTLAIDLDKNLLATLTNNGVSVSVDNSNGIDWNNSNPFAPVATIFIQTTTFVSGQTVVITFVNNAVKDLDGNGIADTITISAIVP